MNFHFVCNVGSFCTCWAIACFTRMHAVGWMTKESSFNLCGEKFFLVLKAFETTSEASTTSYLVCAVSKVAGP